MGEKIWFYTPSGAETVGPVDIDEIANRIADGTIVGETAVWTKAFGNEWKRADSIYELRFAWKKLESSRVETVSQIPLAIHSLGEAVHASYRYVCALLFKARRFSLWISLIFCVWMATATALVNVVDVEAFLEKMAGGSNYLSALVVGLSEGLSKIFIPKISLQWVFVVVVFSLITVYVRVKGRLMFVFFAFSPLESLGRAWQKTVGRTRSLLIFYTLLECIVNFTIATCLYHFLYVGGFLDNPSQQTADKVIAALLNLESAKWLIYGTSIFLVVSFVKSFAFHFVGSFLFGSIARILAVEYVGIFCKVEEHPRGVENGVGISGTVCFDDGFSDPQNNTAAEGVEVVDPHQVLNQFHQGRVVRLTGILDDVGDEASGNALGIFEDLVPCKAVADQYVTVAGEGVGALDIPHKTEGRVRFEQGVRFFDQFVALAFLRAVGEQTHAGAPDPVEVAHERAAHLGKTDQLGGGAVNVGTRIYEAGKPTAFRRKNGGEGRAFAVGGGQIPKGARQKRARTARVDKSCNILAFCGGDQRLDQRRLGLGEDGGDGVVVIGDHVGRVDQFHPISVRCHLGEFCFHLGGVPEQDNAEVRVRGEGFAGALYDDVGAFVTTQCVNGDFVYFCCHNFPLIRLR